MDREPTSIFVIPSNTRNLEVVAEYLRRRGYQPESIWHGGSPPALAAAEQLGKLKQNGGPEPRIVVDEELVVNPRIGLMLGQRLARGRIARGQSAAVITDQSLPHLAEASGYHNQQLADCRMLQFKFHGAMLVDVEPQ